jgi:transposase
MVYSKIKQLSEEGFSQRKIAKMLGISRNTVSGYFKRSSEEMATWLASTKQRKQILDTHKDLILSWLKEHQDLSASQICDWLEEKQYGEYSESTVRRYVKNLRDEFNIPKTVNTRSYEAIPDPPMGEQAQIDFGQVWVTKPDGNRLKLYVVAFVLSNSRFKYMEWWDHPYNAGDVIQAHENAFRYFGGKPKVIVYDQDRALFVDENYGDIIFTSEFEAYRQTQSFKVHACRGYDPESKGRIENTVGFIKKNFAKNRSFSDLATWNEQAMKWLERKGNGKQHNTTKKVPATVFLEERKHLQPLPNQLFKQDAKVDEKMIRKVHKDNTIRYAGNRYSVPRTTFGKIDEVYLKDSDAVLSIIDLETGELIAQHRVWPGKGELIKTRSHGRNRTIGVKAMMTKASGKFSDTVLAMSFMVRINEEYPRYTRDQLQLIIDLCEYCIKIRPQVCRIRPLIA